MPAIGAPSRAHSRPSTGSPPPWPGSPARCWRRRPKAVARFARLRTLGRIADHAGSWRRRPALWRARRRRDLHDRPGPVSPESNRYTGISGSACCWCGRHVPAQRHPRRARQALPRAGAARDRAGARHGGLAKRFGSLVVAEDIAIELPAGVRHALIGPNGAGKTTLINLMTGCCGPTPARSFSAMTTSPSCRRTSGCGAVSCAPIRSTRCSRISPCWNR